MSRIIIQKLHSGGHNLRKNGHAFDILRRAIFLCFLLLNIPQKLQLLKFCSIVEMKSKAVINGDSVAC